ncbi:hypothetical protein VKA52_17455 [Halobacillus sp. HZG1]|uniref:hypothetical protein n=1 Tax=Halobacillus sp. HZG1 TaxID=3111769 RepID=UPI002DBD96C7|nr:hypothetical protein [Halobacillus sp. HZG1]MEC3885509.1 hypothetical protein [Halobacillus sp. HZG1]
MKTTKERIREWNKLMASEEMSQDLEFTISKVISYLEVQSEELDNLKQKVYTYEALLNEIGKEKFIIEDEDVVKH